MGPHIRINIDGTPHTAAGIGQSLSTVLSHDRSLLIAETIQQQFAQDEVDEVTARIAQITPDIFALIFHESSLNIPLKSLELMLFSWWPYFVHPDNDYVSQMYIDFLYSFPVVNNNPQLPTIYPVAGKFFTSTYTLATVNPIHNGQPRVGQPPTPYNSHSITVPIKMVLKSFIRDIIRPQQHTPQQKG
eukprot:UN01549